MENQKELFVVTSGMAVPVLSVCYSASPSNPDSNYSGLGAHYVLLPYIVDQLFYLPREITARSTATIKVLLNSVLKEIV
jgi:hypothetical protein